MDIRGWPHSRTEHRPAAAGCDRPGRYATRTATDRTSEGGTGRSQPTSGGADARAVHHELDANEPMAAPRRGLHRSVPVPVAGVRRGGLMEEVAPPQGF